MTYPSNIVVWDVETTGLDPKTDKPIEVAWVVVKGGGIIKARRYFLNWHMDIPERATQVHGITRAMIEESSDAGLDPVSVLNELFDDIRDAEGHVTHNGTYFDLLFLLNALNPSLRAATEIELRSTHIDTAAIFKGRGLRIPRQSGESLDAYAKRVLKTHSTFKFNLKAAAESFGIPVGNTHRAMDDVRLTYDLYKKMCLKQ